MPITHSLLSAIFSFSLFLSLPDTLTTEKSRLPFVYWFDLPYFQIAIYSLLVYKILSKIKKLLKLGKKEKEKKTYYYNLYHIMMHKQYNFFTEIKKQQIKPTTIVMTADNAVITDCDRVDLDDHKCHKHTSVSLISKWKENL